MNIGERLALARKTIGMNQSEFAKELAIKQTALSMIETGNNELSEKNAKIVCLKFGINYEWLMYGDGEMYKSDDSDAQAIVDAAMTNASDFVKETMVKFAKMDKEHWTMLEELVKYLSNL